MPNFESFNRRTAHLGGEPHVTVHRRGSMSINRPAYDALGTPGAVELLFDRARGVMGFRAADPASDNAASLRRASNSPHGTWVVSAIAFVKFYDIDTAVARRWPAFLDDGILCADLSQAGTAVSSNRAMKPPRPAS